MNSYEPGKYTILLSICQPPVTLSPCHSLAEPRSRCARVTEFRQTVTFRSCQTRRRFDSFWMLEIYAAPCIESQQPTQYVPGVCNCDSSPPSARVKVRSHLRKGLKFCTRNALAPTPVRMIFSWRIFASLMQISTVCREGLFARKCGVKRDTIYQLTEAFGGSGVWLERALSTRSLVS